MVKRELDESSPTPTADPDETPTTPTTNTKSRQRTRTPSASPSKNKNKKVRTNDHLEQGQGQGDHGEISTRQRVAEAVVLAGLANYDKKALEKDLGLSARKQLDLLRSDGKGSVYKALMEAVKKL